MVRLYVDQNADYAISVDSVESDGMVTAYNRFGIEFLIPMSSVSRTPCSHREFARQLCEHGFRGEFVLLDKLPSIPNKAWYAISTNIKNYFKTQASQLV